MAESALILTLSPPPPPILPSAVFYGYSELLKATQKGKELKQEFEGRPEKKNWKLLHQEAMQ